MLSILKAARVALPRREQIPDVKLLATVFERMSMIREDGDSVYLLDDFAALAFDYPYSMLSHEVTEAEGVLVALFYLFRPHSSGKYGLNFPEYLLASLPPAEQDHCLYDTLCFKLENEDFHFFSMEQLAILFGRSKSTIHLLIEEYKDRVRSLLDQSMLARVGVVKEQLLGGEEEKTGNGAQNMSRMSKQPNEQGISSVEDNSAPENF
jgi:hypothetical protein